MVDITVDAKPIEKLPYDPNDIPEAVRKRAAAVDALYSGGTEQLTSAVAPPAQVPASPENVPPTPAPSAPASPEELDPNSNTWKSRALSKEGRERAELEQAHKDLGELQEKFYNEVIRQQQQPSRRAAPPPKSKAFLTERDEQNYGRDLLNMSQRAALHTIAPHLDQLARENSDLRQRLAKQDRRAMDNAVELAVPNYREVDRNPRWHRWLLGIDVLSGRVRQTLLNEAISAGSAPRVISFFKSFLAEEVATGHEQASTTQLAPSAPREASLSLASLAAPGRARPATGGDASWPTDKPVYTRAQIKQLYEQHRRGAYTGREAEWARLEADIFAAQREGRFRS